MKVVVIGAGLSGLVTLKECLAEGFIAVALEALPCFGGQWAYAEPDPDSGEVLSSMYKNVIANTSRDTSGFSDFPFDPARYGDYVHHRKFLQYLEEYAAYFDLNRHIRFNTKVLKCTQLENGKWTVTSASKDGKITEEVYDAILAAPGHNSIPKIPDFVGKDNFKGEILHSHVYRTPCRFEGKKVVLIGLGNSALDLANELCTHAEEVHVLTRRGAYIVPRYAFGKPIEAFNSRASETLVPVAVANWAQNKILSVVQGAYPPELQPNHRILEALPLINGEFLEKLRRNEITVHRATVEKITANGILTTEGKEIEADTIIVCTGYKVDYPFLPDDAYRSTNPALFDIMNATDLYKLMHPINYKNLFIIGLVEIAGTQSMIAEAQARWTVAVLAGKIPLPSPEEMAKDIKAMQVAQQATYVRNDNITFTAPFLEYCDSLLAPLGAAPSFWGLFSQIFTSGSPLRSFQILNAVYNGVTVPPQYRLFGHHSCPDLASETMLRINQNADVMTEKENALLKAAREKKFEYQL